METMSKRQKLEKALLDPEYRLRLLQEGDEDLREIINSALVAAEMVFLAAADAAGLQTVIKTLHSGKANHQACSL